MNIHFLQMPFHEFLSTVVFSHDVFMVLTETIQNNTPCILNGMRLVKCFKLFLQYSANLRVNICSSVEFICSQMFPTRY